MVRLTLLGGLRIEDPDGPLPGRASQRRRLGLLALLASPPHHHVARDKLTAYLWPDANDERARHSLSSALYDLRAELGEDAVMASGDELMLNTAVVRTDVARFEAAQAEGDLAEAVDAYAGPFLDGFFLSDAEEFERWADGERQRYARAYQEALHDLARQRAQAGDLRGAADAWHRLSVADPYSARVAIGYMKALEAIGDRAGALQFARVHTALLREEFGAQPEPEVTALAERLRETPLTSPAGALPVDPDGVRPEAPAAATVVQRPSPYPTTDLPALSPVAAPARTSRRAVWALAVLGLALAAAGTVTWALAGRGALEVLGADERVGVAVLPFQNLSGSEAMDPFSEGLTEEIISGLGRVQSLRIPSRTTIISYQRRAAPVATVGAELGVAYVLEGTVRSENERIRITANLVEAGQGSVIWRDQYDLRMVSVFQAQEEIAQAVVRAVAPQLAGVVGPLVEPTTRDPAAYSLYLKGRAHWYGRSPDDLRSALSYFQDALDQDPGYALAYSAIADVHNQLGAFDYGLAAPSRTFPLAREAAERALELDPDLPEAHAALGNVLFNYDWDLPAAEASYRRAIRLNPGYGMARHWLSLLLSADGRHDEGLREIYRARELDPRSPVLSTSLARHHYFRRDFERALDEYETAIALDPTYAMSHLGAGLVLVALGEYDRALEHYAHAADLVGTPFPATLALIAHAEARAGRRARAVVIERDLLRQRSAGVYVPPHYLAMVALGLGDQARAIALLGESLQERSAAMIYARMDPVVDLLRPDPGFQALLRQIGPMAPAERPTRSVSPRTAAVPRPTAEAAASPAW
jgi:TolB-like protein/DNA-binding SARP family transcriptional activator/Tfp pilus assembly protein PilF